MKILNPLPVVRGQETLLNYTIKSQAIPAAFRHQIPLTSASFSTIFMGIHHYLGQLGF
jgi:hypothetical protein